MQVPPASHTFLAQRFFSTQFLSPSIPTALIPFNSCLSTALTPRKTNSAVDDFTSSAPFLAAKSWAQNGWNVFATTSFYGE